MRWSFILLLLAAMSPIDFALAQTISVSRSLSFGKFVAEGGGSVTVAPSGTRSATGTVRLIASGPGSSAAFSVSAIDPADADRAFIISLPSDNSIVLQGPVGTMPIQQFTSEPAGTGVLTAGTQTVLVGATLTVAQGQSSGSYSGSFPIIIHYQ